jgi:hypothetical protein
VIDLKVAEPSWLGPLISGRWLSTRSFSLHLQNPLAVVHPPAPGGRACRPRGMVTIASFSLTSLRSEGTSLKLEGRNTVTLKVKEDATDI